MPNPPPLPTFWEISYRIAYFVLPNYAHTRLSKVVELIRDSPEAAGPFFYVMACQMSKVEPTRAEAERFSWKVGTLDDQTDYFVMVHPTPPPFELVKLGPAGPAGQPLCPHFSGIFRDRATHAVDYFVLGQSPIGGGTTLRSVTVDPMVNANLGPGPEPDLDSFLAAVLFRRSK